MIPVISTSLNSPNDWISEPQGLAHLVNVLLEGWLWSLDVRHDLPHPPDDRVSMYPHQPLGDILRDGQGKELWARVKAIYDGELHYLQVFNTARS